MRQARGPGGGTPVRPSLAETATLDAGLAQQLAVLLLRHTLAALLDHGAHTNLPLETMWLGLGVPGGTDPLPIWTTLRALAAREQRRIEPGTNRTSLPVPRGRNQNGP